MLAILDQDQYQILISNINMKYQSEIHGVLFCRDTIVYTNVVIYFIRNALTILCMLILIHIIFIFRFSPWIIINLLIIINHDTLLYGGILE